MSTFTDMKTMYEENGPGTKYFMDTEISGHRTPDTTNLIYKLIEEFIIGNLVSHHDGWRLNKLV